MKELASVAVGAIGGGVELSADLGLEIGRQVNFLHEFVLAMCEGALVFKFALAAYFPVSAHFSLLLHLVLPHEILPFLLIPEVLARFLQSG